jgi:hypothetical protein
MASASGTVVAIEEASGVIRKVAKILPYRIGFAVLTPYHRSRAGFLCRHTVDYSKRYIKVPVVADSEGSGEEPEVVSYAASNRVKLSFHEDGFVQFSGETQGTITSGKDSGGQAKGMGLTVNRLGAPLATEGPNFGLTVSYIEEFDAFEQDDKCAVFTNSDIYLRDCTAEDWDYFVIEGFIMPRFPAMNRAQIGPRGLVLHLAFRSFNATPLPSGLYLPSAGTPSSPTFFELRLIDLGPHNVVAGILISKAKSSLGSMPRFSVSSPSDGHHAMFAAYPNPFPNVEVRSLDYLPDARGDPAPA